MTLNEALLEMNKIIKLLLVEGKKNKWERYWDSNIPSINAKEFIKNKYNEEIAPYLDVSARTTLSQIMAEEADTINRLYFEKFVNRYGYFTQLEITSLYAICIVLRS